MLEKLYIADKTLDELMQLFDCEVSNDDDFYDVIAYNIAKENKEAILNNIFKLDNKRLRAAIFGLGLTEETEGVVDVLVGFLTHENPMIVAETLDALKNMKSKKVFSEIDNYYQHKSDYVRAAALRYIVACNESESELENYFIGALRDVSPIVRQSAIDEIADLGDIKYLDKIKELISDENESVKQAAESAINQLLDQE